MTVTEGTDSSPAGPQLDRLLAKRSDVELLRLVRAGDDEAFGELFVRHAGAVRTFAMRSCGDVADAEDMAAEAFFRVFQAVRRGHGPDDNVRAYLLTVVRRLAVEWRMRRRDVPVADDELRRQVDASYPQPTSAADIQLIARAFTTLPRRWRAVLWRVEVEGERPAAAARHFGLSPNATAALARRARQGLRAAYLQAHLAPSSTGPRGCRVVVSKLGAFTAGQVAGAEADRVREHLAGCVSCQALHAELRDVCRGLRRYAESAAAPVAGAALGWHGAFAKVTGHAAALAARLKLAVAAVSVTAVSGVGFAAVPVVIHLDPSPAVNHGARPGLHVVPPVTSPTAHPTSTPSGTHSTPASNVMPSHPQSSSPSPSSPPQDTGTPASQERSSQLSQDIQDPPSGNTSVASDGQQQHVPPGQLKPRKSGSEQIPQNQEPPGPNGNGQAGNQQ